MRFFHPWKGIIDSPFLHLSPKESRAPCSKRLMALMVATIANMGEVATMANVPVSTNRTSRAKQAPSFFFPSFLHPHTFSPPLIQSETSSISFVSPSSYLFAPFVVEANGEVFGEEVTAALCALGANLVAICFTAFTDRAFLRIMTLASSSAYRPLFNTAD